jgi:hypothetical protein
MTLTIFSPKTSPSEPAEDREVLGEHAHRPAVDRAVPVTTPSPYGALLVHAEVAAPVPGELVELDEGALVEQRLDPFPAVLRPCACRFSTRPCDPAWSAASSRDRRSASLPPVVWMSGDPAGAGSTCAASAIAARVARSTGREDWTREPVDRPAASAAAQAALARALTQGPEAAWRAIEVVAGDRLHERRSRRAGPAGEPRDSCSPPTIRPPAAAASAGCGRRRPRAGLAVSVLLRPSVDPARWSWLPLLTGLAVVDALTRVCGVPPAEVAQRRPRTRTGPRAAAGAGRAAQGLRRPRRGRARRGRCPPERPSSGSASTSTRSATSCPCPPRRRCGSRAPRPSTGTPCCARACAPLPCATADGQTPAVTRGRAGSAPRTARRA